MPLRISPRATPESRRFLRGLAVPFVLLPWVAAACGTSLESAAVDDGTPYPDQSEERDATSPSPVTPSPALDGASGADGGRRDGSSGRDAAVEASPEPVSCAQPVVRALTLPSDSANGTLELDAPRQVACASGAGTSGSALAADTFALQVTARTGIVLRATSTDSEVVVDVRRQCADPGTALACGADPRIQVPAAPPRSGALQTVLEPGYYFVVVSLSPMGAALMHYNLTLESFAPAGNATCAGATPLADGTVLPSETFSRGAGPDLACPPAGSVSSGWQQVALYYSAAVPPGASLIVAATQASRLTVRDGCLAQACLASGAPHPIFGGHGFVEYVNPGAATQNVVIGVDHDGPPHPQQGDFALSSWIRAAPSNTVCTAARRLSGSTKLRVEDAARGTGSAASACVPSASLGNLYYVVTVPAGQRLTATMSTPYGPWPPVLRLLPSCGASSCFAYSDPGIGHDAKASYLNSSASSVDVVIAAGSHAGPPNTGPFDLDVVLGP